jgi:prepilin-type N-terminal cleavage/methylation domain-containing protein
MKNFGKPSRRRTAFTLVELLVVMAVIGILASLLFPITGAVNRAKQIKTARTQLEALVLAIDGYKTKLGFYPPDNPNNPAINQLYFELQGTTNNGTGGANPTVWGTLDGTAQIGTTTTPNFTTVFGIGVTSIANSSTRARSDDNGSAAGTFINNLTANQIGSYDATNSQVKFLVCSVPWPREKTPAPIPTNPDLNPFCYVSSHPTNNATSYDLWVDVVYKGKTNRVCNWSTQPIKL